MQDGTRRNPFAVALGVRWRKPAAPLPECEESGFSLFSGSWGQQRPLPPAHLRNPGEGSMQRWRNKGATGSAVWGAKLSSERSPRRGEPAQGESLGTVWRLVR